MALPPSFRRHGTFVYNAAATIDAVGSPSRVAGAMAAAGMSHAWIRVHGRTATHANDEATRRLIAALRDRNIAVAGWGWCHGDDPAAEARLALRSLRDLDLVDYVADIEQGVQQAHWTPGEVEQFLGRVREALPPAGAIAVSSFAVITWHAPELMRAADRFVDAFAPQTYWFRFPNNKMRRQFGSAYPLDNAAAYVDLCIANWRGVTAKPLIATGQAYSGEGISTADAETKVRQFLRDYDSWSDVAGFNWWHFAGGNGMTRRMFDEIAAARLDTKPYA